ncbi:MAG: hypothetical protein ACOZNI_09915 [Myxococcota bacterium]
MEDCAPNPAGEYPSGEYVPHRGEGLLADGERVTLGTDTVTLWFVDGTSATYRIVRER